MPRFPRTFHQCWHIVPLELQIEILLYLALPDLLVLRQVEGFASLAASALLRRFRDLLLFWRLDDEETEEMMRRTETVISGSAGLYMVAPSTWYPEDLDFYCPFAQVDVVLRHFLSMGYETVPNVPPRSLTDHDYVPTQAMAEVHTLVSVAPSTRKINVIRSTTASACAPIPFFHSTMVMNVVNDSGVFCLYPSLTLAKRAVRNYTRPVMAPPQPGEDTDRDEGAIEKYRGRGYMVHEHCDDVHGSEDSTCIICQDAFRSVSDEHAMTMEFNDDGARTPLPRAYWKLGRLLPARRISPSQKLIEQLSTQVVVEGEQEGSAHHHSTSRIRYASVVYC